MTEARLQQAEREHVRWLILAALYAGRPIGVSEGVILRVVRELTPRITAQALRAELRYLEDQGLVRLRREDELSWFGEITPAGVDIVEYNAPAPKGIARPPKYW